MNASAPQPEFVSLEPSVRGNRVTINLVTRFPPQPNVALDLDFGLAGPVTSKPAADEPPDLEAAIENSPYPNVALHILDEQDQEAAQLFIVEHKEPKISLTLHLRRPCPGGRYTARAVMIRQQTVIQQLDVPFTLEDTTQGGD